MTPSENIVPSCPYCGDSCPVGYGKCHCGCGEETDVITKGDSKKGWIRGLPKKRVPLHGRRDFRVDFTDANPFKIDGVYCKLIPLTRGFVAIVWEIDFDRINRFKWRAVRMKSGVYAHRHGKDSSGKPITISMQREVLGVTDESQVDHKNMNTLDNRRCVLRPASHTEQARNVHCRKHNHTGFKGVGQRSKNSYYAFIIVDGKRIHLGTRHTAAEAHELYKEAAIKYFGEFARFE